MKRRDGSDPRTQHSVLYLNPLKCCQRKVFATTKTATLTTSCCVLKI